MHAAIFAESCFAHAPKNLATRRSVSPEKSHKQGDRPGRDADVKENVLGCGQDEDVELCAKVVLLTFSNNWMVNFELLKKSLRKSTRKT